MHIYFKTCKTILYISCIFFKKHGNDKNSNQVGKGGKKRKRAREGRRRHWASCLQSLTSSTGGGHVGVDTVSLSIDEHTMDKSRK